MQYQMPLRIHNLFLFCALLCTSQFVELSAQETLVTELESLSKQSISSNLNKGVPIELDWASSSSVACFPDTRFYEYMGSHVFYRIDLPEKSKINISVTPTNKKYRINLYALRLGEGDLDVPPQIVKALSCEADYPIYAGKAKRIKKNKTKTIEMVSINKSYTILIGIAGAKGIIEGAFDLEIRIQK